MVDEMSSKLMCVYIVSCQCYSLCVCVLFRDSFVAICDSCLFVGEGLVLFCKQRVCCLLALNWLNWMYCVHSASLTSEVQREHSIPGLASLKKKHL